VVGLAVVGLDVSAIVGLAVVGAACNQARHKHRRAAVSGILPPFINEGTACLTAGAAAAAVTLVTTAASDAHTSAELTCACLAVVCSLCEVLKLCKHTH
jgi:hypothetical protein